MSISGMVVGVIFIAFMIWFGMFATDDNERKGGK